MNSKAKYYPTAFVLYLNYFVQGIATGVLGQQLSLIHIFFLTFWK